MNDQAKPPTQAELKALTDEYGKACWQVGYKTALLQAYKIAADEIDGDSKCDSTVTRICDRIEHMPMPEPTP